MTFEDLDTGSITILGDSDLTVEESNIIFDSERLTSNRRYRILVSASNIGGQASSGDSERISKLIFSI